MCGENDIFGRWENLKIVGLYVSTECFQQPKDLQENKKAAICLLFNPKLGLDEDLINYLLNEFGAIHFWIGW